MINQIMPVEEHIKVKSSTTEAIKAQIATGDFETVDQVVQAGLELLEQRRKKIQALKQALKEGEESPKIKNYDRHQHLASLQSSSIT